MIREALTLERLSAMQPREAAAWFVARRAEGLTPSEDDLLSAWLAADERHGQALRGVERAWDCFDGAAGHEIIAAMRARALEPRAARWEGWRPAAAAAAVILLLLGATMLLFRPPGWLGPGGGADRGRVVEYATASGELREIGLPDGSRMTLGAASRATARFESGARSVELARGRALFEVAADAARPFSVTAGNRRVVAIGTRFDIRLARDALTVSLIEGRVTVGPVEGGVRPATLEAGQQFVERDGRAVIRTIGQDIVDAAGWSRGILRFDDETLAAAAAEMNLYPGAKVVVRDPRVAAMRISGTFHAGEGERFARAVAELRPVRAVRRGDAVELVAR